MDIFRESYPLSNGVSVPKLGLGTWLLSNKQAARAVKAAAELGYRHIDTAQAYENEKGVGEGVRACGVPREQLFVATKVQAEHKTYEAAAASIDESLEKLGLDYVDLILIHAPQPWAEFRSGEHRYFEENRQVWKALEDALNAGKTRAIGVSNFLRDDLESLLSSCEIRPMVNQVLMHISNTPFDLISFCRAQGILVEAYSPIAHGAVLDNEEIAAIAEKYHTGVAPLCVRYVLQHGAVALPKTANPDHMRDNAGVDFTISEEDMKTLDGMEKIRDYGRDGFFPVFARG